MKINKILQILHFPNAKIIENTDLLIEKILRSVRKDWKIKILVLHKQKEAFFTINSVKTLEGKSIAEALKENHLIVESLPKSINHVMQTELEELIIRYKLSSNINFTHSEYLYIAKSLAQELISHTFSRPYSSTLAQKVFLYSYLPMIQQAPMQLLFIEKKSYAICEQNCKKIISNYIPKAN